MLGERAGEARPWGMHHLRARAAWHSHGVASELRGFVIDHLGVADAISVLDEIEDLPERPEFSPTDDGRRGSLPSTYNGGASAPRPDQKRPGREFATKPVQPQVMIAPLDAGIPAHCVTADEALAPTRGWTRPCRSRRRYVVAIASHRRLPVDAASARTPRNRRDLPRRAWLIRSMGACPHGLTRDQATNDLLSDDLSANPPTPCRRPRHAAEASRP